MINSRYSTRANLISHNYLCKPDRHQGWARNTEPVATDWVICPLLFEAEGLWKLYCGELLCRCIQSPYREQNPFYLNISTLDSLVVWRKHTVSHCKESLALWDGCMTPEFALKGSNYVHWQENIVNIIKSKIQFNYICFQACQLS